MSKKALIVGLSVLVGLPTAASFAEQPNETKAQPMNIMENPVERPLKAEPQMESKTKTSGEDVRNAADVMTEHEKERMELRQTKAPSKTENKIEPKNQ